MQGDNSPLNKRTVRHRRKIGTAACAPQPRRAGRPASPFFRRGFPECAAASVRSWRQINDADIPIVREHDPHPIATFVVLYRHRAGFADALAGGARMLRINKQ
jgi:hypothetical protein